MESLAPRREQNTNEATKRMVTCLLLQIDALARTSLPVIVIGATSSPSQVDGALRRFGRFDRELDLGVPDEQGREEIFKVSATRVASQISFLFFFSWQTVLHSPAWVCLVLC